MSEERQNAHRQVQVTRVDGNEFGDGQMDDVAVEEPLEVRVGDESLLVTMRTPGHDADLVRGLLFSEGLVRSPDDVAGVAHCPDVPDEAQGNVVIVSLADGVKLDSEGSARATMMSSACGVCGRATLDSLRESCPEVRAGARLSRDTILSLSETFDQSQPVFSRTGGLHAAGLFDLQGKLLCLREDVGRHNAVDKVIGEAMRFGLLPLEECVLMLSSRASFEIVQKARRAGIPILCSVSAPSSLAVELARDGNQTLIGFLREGRFNIYSGEDRVS